MRKRYWEWVVINETKSMCEWERQNNVCKREIEIMYLDEKEILRRSNHQWDKEYVWMRETEIRSVTEI